MMAANPANEPSQNEARRSRALDGEDHAFGLLRATALIDYQRDAGRGEQAHQFLLEGIGKTLGGILADTEIHRDVGLALRHVPEGHEGFRAGDAEGFGRPTGREIGERAGGIAAIGPALEEMVMVLGTDRQEPKLGEARIGIDYDSLRVVENAAQVLPDGEALAQAAPAVFDGGMVDARIGGQQLIVFSWPDEDQLGVGKAALGGRKHHAGHGDVRPRVTRESTNIRCGRPAIGRIFRTRS